MLTSLHCFVQLSQRFISCFLYYFHYYAFQHLLLRRESICFSMIILCILSYISTIARRHGVRYIMVRRWVTARFDLWMRALCISNAGIVCTFLRTYYFLAGSVCKILSPKSNIHVWHRIAITNATRDTNCNILLDNISQFQLRFYNIMYTVNICLMKCKMML